MTGLLIGAEIMVSLVRSTIQFTFTRNKMLPSFQPYIGSLLVFMLLTAGMRYTSSWTVIPSLLDRFCSLINFIRGN